MYLSKWYWRLKQKKGAKKAIVALARKLSLIIYTMLKTDTYCAAEQFEARREASRKQRTARYIKELEQRGYTIALQPHSTVARVNRTHKATLRLHSVVIPKIH